MADILIRNVPARTVERLKQRAKLRGRSLQAEALAALQADEPYSGNAFLAELARIREQHDIRFDLSAALDALREDRDR